MSADALWTCIYTGELTQLCLKEGITCCSVHASEEKASSLASSVGHRLGSEVLERGGGELEIEGGVGSGSTGGEADGAVGSGVSGGVISENVGSGMGVIGGTEGDDVGPDIEDMLQQLNAAEKVLEHIMSNNGHEEKGETVEPEGGGDKKE